MKQVALHNTVPSSSCNTEKESVFHTAQLGGSTANVNTRRLIIKYQPSGGPTINFKTFRDIKAKFTSRPVQKKKLKNSTQIDNSLLAPNSLGQHRPQIQLSILHIESKASPKATRPITRVQTKKQQSYIIPKVIIIKSLKKE